jgi:hypothetical protein
MTPVYNPNTITDSYIFDSDAKVTVLSCGYFCVYDFSDTTHCTRRRLAGGVGRVGGVGEVAGGLRNLPSRVDTRRRLHSCCIH